MYRSIVVGTDGSERAQRAVAEATMLAKVSGATLHVVHVMRLVSLAAANYGDGEVIARANEDARRSGEQVCAQAAATAEGEGVAAQVHNVDGDPAEMLLQVAETVGADLIVIGNRGMTGVRRFVLGSVPNKISHHCPCSLLIVNTDVA